MVEGKALVVLIKDIVKFFSKRLRIVQKVERREVGRRSDGSCFAFLEKM